MTLPTCQEINPHDDLDGRTASDHFLGKTLQQAEALFRESPIYYQSDLLWGLSPFGTTCRLWFSSFAAMQRTQTLSPIFAAPWNFVWSTRQVSWHPSPLSSLRCAATRSTTGPDSSRGRRRMAMFVLAILSSGTRFPGWRRPTRHEKTAQQARNREIRDLSPRLLQGVEA